MVQPSFVEIGQPALEKIFGGFLPYMGVVDNKLSFPLPMEAPHNIWL